MSEATNPEASNAVAGRFEPIVIRWRSFKTHMQQWFCKHEFLLKDLKKTGIPRLEEPGRGDYKSWAEHIDEVYKHDSHTKRVRWPCRKCEKVFYAHCGLDISPTNGPTVRIEDA